MKNPLPKLPFPVEFAVVVAGAFGYSVISSIQGLGQPHVGGDPTEAGTWWAVGYEFVTILALGVFLWGRGWNAKRLGLDTDWTDGLWALALAVGSLVAANALAVLAVTAFPGLFPHAAKAVAPSLSIFSVGALVLVNGFYEEVFVAGYVITALKEKGRPDLALHLSVAIRVAVHLFQGVTGVLMMIPLGLIFGIWYLRSGRLWPLVLAHTVLVAWSYAQYVKW